MLASHDHHAAAGAKLTAELSVQQINHATQTQPAKEAAQTMQNTILQRQSLQT